MRPALLSTALKEQKAASERGLQDLAKGNHDGVPSASICRRLMKEVLAEKDFADDPYEDSGQEIRRPLRLYVLSGRFKWHSARPIC